MKVKNVLVEEGQVWRCPGSLLPDYAVLITDVIPCPEHLKGLELVSGYIVRDHRTVIMEGPEDFKELLFRELPGSTWEERLLLLKEIDDGLRNETKRQCVERLLRKSRGSCRFCRTASGSAGMKFDQAVDDLLEQKRNSTTVFSVRRDPGEDAGDRLDDDNSPESV